MTNRSQTGFDRRVFPRLALLLLIGVIWLPGCREQVPQSELDRFIAEHKDLPRPEYEELLRSLTGGPAPESVYAHYELGNLFYAAAGDTGEVTGLSGADAEALLDSAQLHFERAVELDSTFVQAYVNLGSLWDDLADKAGGGRTHARLRRECHAKAHKMYQRALEFDPTDEKALCNLGALYMKQRQVGQAVAQFQAALAAHPKAPWPTTTSPSPSPRRGSTGRRSGNGKPPSRRIPGETSASGPGRTSRSSRS